MPFVAVFATSWIIFFLFADKSRWRQFLPACFLAMLLSTSSDVVVVQHKLWSYHDPSDWILKNSYVHLLDDLGIYPVVTYLFLQYYPAARTLLYKVLYFVAWTTFAITVEHTHTYLGLMQHHNGWSHWHSYVADWVLLYLLLFFHNVYNRLEAPIFKKTPDYVPFLRAMGLELDFIAEHDDYEVYLLEMKPGGCAPAHSHAAKELVLVLKGEIEVTIGQRTETVTQGKIVALPGDIVHSGRNIGTDTALVLCVNSPAGLKKNLLQKTQEQLASEELPLRL